MNNVEISKILEETARALDFVGAEPIIVAEFAKAARRAETADVPLEVFAKASKSRRASEELDRALAFWFPDVLSNVVAELRELIATGTFPLRRALENDVSPRAFAMLRLKSLDPDDVFFLREEMIIRDVAALKIAAQNGVLSGSGAFSREEETQILDEIQRVEAEKAEKNVENGATSDESAESDENDGDAACETAENDACKSAASDAEMLAFYADEPEVATVDSALMFLANADALGDFVLQSLRETLENEIGVDAARALEEAARAESNENATKNERGRSSSEKRTASRGASERGARSRSTPKNASGKTTNAARETNEPTKKSGKLTRIVDEFGVKLRNFFFPRWANENSGRKFDFWTEIQRLLAPPSQRGPSFGSDEDSYFADWGDFAARVSETSANVPPWTRVAKVGALARRDDSVSQLDFLLETEAPERAFALIKSAPFVQAVLEESTRFLAVELKPSAFAMPYNARPTPKAPLRFFAATNLTFGARELATTATPEHWRTLRERSAKRGWNLTAFGLYSGASRIASRTPNRVYERLETPFIPAELRANRAEWSWSDAGAPELLTLDDMRGDMHLHSTFSDGTGDFDEIVAEALRLGREYVAATDHTKNVRPIVNGMDDAEVLRYWDFIDDLNRKLRDSGVDFRVLKGAEVDILDDGRLDLTDETLARADWIVASLHFGSSDPPRRLQERYLAALSHPAVDVVAHPTGRTIGTKGPMRIDVEFLCENAAKYGKFLELNAQPRRLDLDVDGLIAAKKAGVPIVISTDAHSPSHLEYLRFGVEQARRAGLTRADVANARPLEELLRWRDERRANAAASAK